MAPPVACAVGGVFFCAVVLFKSYGGYHFDALLFFKSLILRVFCASLVRSASSGAGLYHCSTFWVDSATK